MADTIKKLTTAEVKFWCNEAKSCVERQKVELIQRNSYPALVRYYEGEEQVDNAYPHVSTAKRMAIINEFFPNTNALISEIIYQNPDLLLEPTNPNAAEDLPLMRSALDYLFDKTPDQLQFYYALFLNPE